MAQNKILNICHFVCYSYNVGLRDKSRGETVRDLQPVSMDHPVKGPIDVTIIQRIQ